MTGDDRERLRLDDQICFALYAATNAVVRSYRPLLGGFGLTYPQYLVMLALWQDGAMQGNVLARRLQLGPSAVVPLLDRLEAAGFVTRDRAADRRVVLIGLTDAGRELEAKVSVAQRTVECRTGLARQSLTDLRRELQDLTDRIAATGVVPRNEPI